MNDDPVREINHRMAMARPWDAAENGSIWGITGATPDGHLFAHAPAVCLVEPTDHEGDPGPRAFCLIPGFSERACIHPSSISSARPLLLVHRDDPTTAYEETDQAWITEANR